MKKKIVKSIAITVLAMSCLTTFGGAGCDTLFRVYEDPCTGGCSGPGSAPMT